jgi:O-antigen/teichoic acid export membrane protein
MIRPVRAIALQLIDAGLERPTMRIGHGFWGFADQALTSAVSLVTTLLAATAMDQTQFGGFVIALTAIYLLNAIQAGAVTRPHNLLGSVRVAEGYRRYTTTTTLLQLAFSGGSAVLGVVAIVVASALAPNLVGSLAALTVAAVAWQMQEFLRRVLYTEERGHDAFVNDVVSYGGQALLLAVLALAGLMTETSALLVIAATSCAGVVLGFFQIRRSLTRAIDPAAMRENIAVGKWLAAAEAGHWTSTQIYFYVAAAMLGPAAAGAIRAVQVLVGPLRMFLMFLYSILPVSFARARARDGAGALHREVIRAYAFVVPCLAAYCVTVAILAGPLLRFLYQEKYAAASGLVVLTSIQYFFICLTPIVTCLLQAQGLARHLFLVQVYVSAISLPFGWLLVRAFGVDGAVVGMTISAVATNVYAWVVYRRMLHRWRAEGVAA